MNRFNRVPEERTNGQAKGQNGESEGGGHDRRNTNGAAGGGGGSETEVRVMGNGTPIPQPPVVTFTQVKPRIVHIKGQYQCNLLSGK